MAHFSVGGNSFAQKGGGGGSFGERMQLALACYGFEKVKAMDVKAGGECDHPI